MAHLLQSDLLKKFFLEAPHETEAWDFGVSRHGHGTGGSGLHDVNDTVGETGPAGGLVFYDKGSYSGSSAWRYLEVAPADQLTVNSANSDPHGIPGRNLSPQVHRGLRSAWESPTPIRLSVLWGFPQNVPPHRVSTLVSEDLAIGTCLREMSSLKYASSVRLIQSSL